MKICLLAAAGALLLITVSQAQEESENLCFEEAGQMYNISPDLLTAIAVVESNVTVNKVSASNKNKTIDFCHMQINSVWKGKLGARWQYLQVPCYCTKIGAWVLRQCIDRYGYNWDAVACYNTGKSTKSKSEKRNKLGEKYIRKVQLALMGVGVKR